MTSSRMALATGLIASLWLASARAEGDPAVKLPTDPETWKALPAVEAGGGGPLPVWAKAVWW